MRHPSLVRAVPVALLALALSGCSGLKISSDWDKEIDFTRYGTFRWARTQQSGDGPPKTAHSLLDKRIKRSVGEELDRKGYVEQKSGRPDILLVYAISMQDYVNVTHYPRRYGGYSSASSYREGTLVITAVDPLLGEEGEGIWEGYAIGLLAGSHPDEEKIRKVIHEVMKTFPARRP